MPPPLPPDTPLPPKRELDIGRCFSDAMEVYQKNLGMFVLAAFLFWVLSIIPPLILVGPLWGGVCMMTLNAMTRDDKRIEFSDMFIGFNRFFPLIGLFLITLIAMLAGCVVLIIPGLFLMTIWLFPTYLMMDKGVGVFDALGMSYRVVMRGGFWKNFSLALLIVLISIAPEMVPYLGIIISWFVVPIAWLVNTSAYIQLVREEAPAVEPGDGDPARCGRCGYAMRGVTTFNCPECGADLREVGMIPTQI
jgi:hypothetical protein